MGSHVHRRDSLIHGFASDCYREQPPMRFQPHSCEGECVGQYQEPLRAQRKGGHHSVNRLGDGIRIEVEGEASVESKGITMLCEEGDSWHSSRTIHPRYHG